MVTVSGEAAVKQAELDALAEGPLNKKQVVEAVKAALPEVGQNRIRAIMHSMTKSQLKVTFGQKGPQEDLP